MTPRFSFHDLARKLLMAFAFDKRFPDDFSRLWAMVGPVDKFCRSATTTLDHLMGATLTEELDAQLRRFAPKSKHPDAEAVAELLKSKPAWKKLVRLHYDFLYKR